MKKPPKNTYSFQLDGKQYYARVFNMGNKPVDCVKLGNAVNKEIEKHTQPLRNVRQSHEISQKEWIKTVDRLSEQRDIALDKIVFYRIVSAILAAIVGALSTAMLFG